MGISGPRKAVRRFEGHEGGAQCSIPSTTPGQAPAMATYHDQRTWSRGALRSGESSLLFADGQENIKGVGFLSHLGDACKTRRLDRKLTVGQMARLGGCKNLTRGANRIQ